MKRHPIRHLIPSPNEIFIAWSGFYLLALAYIASQIWPYFTQNGFAGIQTYFTSQAFVASLAQHAPVPFWGVIGLLTAAAAWGWYLTLRALFSKKMDPHTRRQRYLQAVTKAYKPIWLVIDPDDVKQLPEIVYQDLLWLEDSERLSTDQGLASSSGAQPATLDQILDRGRRAIVVLGWPGGGKTTLLRHHMSVRAQDIQADASAKLPVYINLPLFASYADKNDGVKTYLMKYEEALNNRDAVFAGHLRDEVKDGNAYLYLDGLDEVDNSQRDAVITWIKERQRTLTIYGALMIGTRYIDYSRSDFHSAADLPRNKAAIAVFTELVAQPMSAENRADIANKLLPALAEKYEKPEPTPAQINAFLALIEKVPSRAEWAANPLLFSLAAAIYVSHYLDESEGFPTSRVTLYQQFIQTLLAKVVRKRQTAGTGKGLRSAVLQEMVRLLAEVTVRLFNKSTSEGKIGEFSERDLTRAVDDARDALHLYAYESGVMPAWVIDSGTLSQTPQHTYTYRHKTYREYLAALGHMFRLLKKMEQRSDIDRLRFRPEWTEPMRMLAGVLVADQSDEGTALAKAWLTDLVELEKNSETDVRINALELLVASLSEIPDVESFAQREQIDAGAILVDWVKALMQLAQSGDRGALGRLQRLTPGVATLPHELAQRALDQLDQALADDVHPERQIAAAQALAGMGSLVTNLMSLVWLVREGRDVAARIEAARALASIERNDQSHPGRADLDAIVTGPDVSLACIATQGLAGVDNPDAVELMRAAVAPARDVTVRRLGTKALGSVGARTKADLYGRLQDEDDEVREIALAELTRLGENNEALRAAIRSHQQRGGDVSSVLQNLLPYTLRQLGFTARSINGIEIIVLPLRDVPAGPFLMGSDKKKDKEASDDETPQHTVTLGAFQIGAYPVTVAEYACAVRAQAVKEPPASGGISWQKQLGRLDHPVVCVSWHDVVAYAAWLAQVTGQPWRLPTEAEWEKAARGTDGRIYPWGNTWDKTRANTRDGGPGTTTPVGAYADKGDASPYGAHDQAGNVWEWTSTLWGYNYPYNPSDGRENLQSTGSRVLRGGSWSSTPGDARAAFRNYVGPVLLYYGGGFRLARGAGAGSSEIGQ